MRGKHWKAALEMLRSMDGIEEAFVRPFNLGDDSCEIMKRLIVIRMCQGKRQEDIAKSLGCDSANMCKIERKKDAQLKLGTLKAYAEALGYEFQITVKKKEAEVKP